MLTNESGCNQSTSQALHAKALSPDAHCSLMLLSEGLALQARLHVQWFVLFKAGPAACRVNLQ